MTSFPTYGHCGPVTSSGNFSRLVFATRGYYAIGHEENGPNQPTLTKELVEAMSHLFADPTKEMLFVTCF